MAEKLGMDSEDVKIPADYGTWLTGLKARIRSARARAVLSVNEEMVWLYHRMGVDILARQQSQGWGAKVIDRLSADLREAFPDVKGLSVRNLKYMRDFARLCPDIRFGQQPAAQLPWFHIVTLLTKVGEPTDRAWYAAQAAANGWPRATLEANIKAHLHQRQGTAVTNFERRLEGAHARMAIEALKDPYHLDFLGVSEEAQERDIEQAAIHHITRFLMELGAGFAFVGRQFRLEVDGEEFFIDLLLYHTRLKCYVVVELKAAAFKPEHAGKLSFYLAAVDARIRADDDKPTIGLLLCRTKNRMMAEYALSGMTSTIGVAEYQLVRALPDALGTSLPSIEDIEAALGDV